MTRNHITVTDWVGESLKNPTIKAEYDKLQPEFAVVQAMIDARMGKNVTQKALAKKIGTKQSVISRLETGRGNPSVAFLKKFAAALNTRLEIRFT